MIPTVNAERPLRGGRVLRGLFFLLLAVSLRMVTAQEIPFTNYTNQNGLPQSTVYDIVEDNQGYLWFATQVGAARFDGYEFETFNTSNGLVDEFINCLLVDMRGRIWFGTEGGLTVYNGSRFQSFTAEDGLIDNRIDLLVEDKAGNIWAMTQYGISVLTGDTILSYSSDDALYSNYITDILPDSEGRVHVATSYGLTLFLTPFTYEKKFESEIIRDVLETSTGTYWYATQEDGIWVSDSSGDRKLGYREGLTDEVVLSLMEDHEGRIWCGTYVEGLFIYEHGSFRHISTGQRTEPLALRIMEDSRNRVWLQTYDQGIWLYDNGEFRHFTQSNTLVDDFVQDMFEDKFGNIWLATRGGASKYGRVIFEIFNMDQGLPEERIQSVFRDSQGRIWFGTESHLFYYDRSTMYQLDARDPLPASEIPPLAFTENDRGEIFIGTGMLLLRYRGRSLVPIFRLKNDYSQFYSLLYTPDQRLWCATDSGIHILENLKRTAIIGENEGLVNAQVNDLELMEDRICCATEGGISVFNLQGGHLKNITTGDGLVSDVCLDVTGDSLGNLWVATNKGISRIETKNDYRITNFTSETGLTSNITYFVQLGDEDRLWIGTERGLDVLNVKTEKVDFYGYEDGFRPLETNEKAVTREPGGDLWIGTVAGLVHYMPRYNKLDLTPPDLILFPPIVDGQEFTLREGRKSRSEFPPEPSFPYNKNTLEFDWTGIHTTIPSKNRFSYILEGYDDGWSTPGSDRSVRYRKLPNGDYIFKVEAYNLDGIPVNGLASFAFTIKPPFWKTVWFIIFEGIMGLLLIYGLIQYRERQLIREKRILETRVKERTREIEEQKAEIESQRDEISEQKQFVEEQRDKIAIQNQEITDSIVYAKRIQQAALPGKLTLERTLPEHFILFKPRDIVSGDFYWVEEKNSQVYVCAADCTGHGVPGAFMSLLGLTFLNEIVNKDGISKADEILNRLRKYIMDALSHRDETSETRDGMDLALVVIDPQTRTLDYAGAYNPLILVRDGMLIETRADKMPIGTHVGEDTPFKRHKMDLKKGDMIYLFTDGFKDQFGGSSGKKFKSKPFKRLLLRMSTENVEEQHKMIEKELTEWMGTIDQIDDILVIGIRINV